MTAETLGYDALNHNTSDNMIGENLCNGFDKNYR